MACPDKARAAVIGRRTGCDVLAGKNIQKLTHGFENFDDYWTEEESDDSIASFVKHLNGKQPEVPAVQPRRATQVGQPIRSMSPFTPSDHELTSHLLKQKHTQEGDKENVKIKDPEPSSSQEPVSTSSQDLAGSSETVGSDLQEGLEEEANDASGEATESQESQDISVDESQEKTIAESDNNDSLSQNDVENEASNEEHCVEKSGTLKVVAQEQSDGHDETDLESDSSQALKLSGNALGSISRPETAAIVFPPPEPNSALQNFKTRKRLTYSSELLPERSATSDKSPVSNEEPAQFKVPALPTKKTSSTNKAKANDEENYKEKEKSQDTKEVSNNQPPNKVLTKQIAPLKKDDVNDTSKTVVSAISTEARPVMEAAVDLTDGKHVVSDSDKSSQQDIHTENESTEDEDSSFEVSDESHNLISLTLRKEPQKQKDKMPKNEKVNEANNKADNLTDGSHKIQGNRKEIKRKSQAAPLDDHEQQPPKKTRAKQPSAVPGRRTDQNGKNDMELKSKDVTEKIIEVGDSDPNRGERDEDHDTNLKDNDKKISAKSIIVNSDSAQSDNDPQQDNLKNLNNKEQENLKPKKSKGILKASSKSKELVPIRTGAMDPDLETVPENQELATKLTNAVHKLSDKLPDASSTDSTGSINPSNAHNPTSDLEDYEIVNPKTVVASQSSPSDTINALYKKKTDKKSQKVRRSTFTKSSPPKTKDEDGKRRKSSKTDIDVNHVPTQNLLFNFDEDDEEADSGDQKTKSGKNNNKKKRKSSQLSSDGNEKVSNETQKTKQKKTNNSKRRLVDAVDEDKDDKQPPLKKKYTSQKAKQKSQKQNQDKEKNEKHEDIPQKSPISKQQKATRKQTKRTGNAQNIQIEEVQDQNGEENYNDDIPVPDSPALKPDKERNEKLDDLPQKLPISKQQKATRKKPKRTSNVQDMLIEEAQDQNEVENNNVEDIPVPDTPPLKPKATKRTNAKQKTRRNSTVQEHLSIATKTTINEEPHIEEQEEIPTGNSPSPLKPKATKKNTRVQRPSIGKSDDNITESNPVGNNKIPGKSPKLRSPSLRSPPMRSSPIKSPTLQPKITKTKTVQKKRNLKKYFNGSKKKVSRVNGSTRSKRAVSDPSVEQETTQSDEHTLVDQDDMAPVFEESIVASQEDIENPVSPLTSPPHVDQVQETKRKRKSSGNKNAFSSPEDTQTNKNVGRPTTKTPEAFELPDETSIVNTPDVSEIKPVATKRAKPTGGRGRHTTGTTSTPALSRRVSCVRLRTPDGTEYAPDASVASPKSILKRARLSSAALPRASVSSPIHYFERTQTATPKTADMLKKSVKIIIPKTAPEGVRRSSRTRVKTLEWYNNERIKYDRRKSGGLVVAGILESEIRSDEKKESRKKKLERLIKKKTKPKAVIPRTPKNLSVHQPLPEDCEENDDNPTPVINPMTNTEVLIDCVCTKDNFNFFGLTGKPATEEDPLILCKTLKQKVFSLGQLVLRGGEEKSTQFVRNDSMVFVIKQGKLAVTIHRLTYLLETDDNFFVPQGNTYSIKNLRNDEAKLWFFQHKG